MAQPKKWLDLRKWLEVKKMARLKNGSRWYGNRGVCTNHHHHHNQLSPTIYTTNPIAPLSIIYHKHIHSPIIHHSTQQDIQETKQMLIMEQDMVDITMDHIHSSWQNQRKQWQEWQEFQEWKQFKQYKQWRDSTGREYQQEMRILHQLVQIVQTFIIIICGMRMISCLQ
eukprot:502747_1